MLFVRFYLTLTARTIIWPLPTPWAAPTPGFQQLGYLRRLGVSAPSLDVSNQSILFSLRECIYYIYFIIDDLEMEWWCREIHITFHLHINNLNDEELYLPPMHLRPRRYHSILAAWKSAVFPRFKLLTLIVCDLSFALSQVLSILVSPTIIVLGPPS